NTLSQEWDGLLEHDVARNIFLTPQWQELCWRNLHDESWELFLFSVRGGNDPLGIAPLRRRGDTICFIGNAEVSDYLDFILKKGEEETFYQVLLDTLKAEDWATLDLCSLSASSPTLKHLPPMALSLGFSVTVEEETVAPAMDLPSSWDEYLASLDKKERHELRRKARRMAANVSPRYYSLEGQELNHGMDDFLRLHRVSKDDKAIFMNEQMEGFFRAMAARFAEEGWARLYFLEANEERVATALCFQYGNESLLYNSGFDPAYGWLSVGLLLKSYCIQDAIESGKKRFDFLRGSEHYKYELGGVDMPVYRCVVRRT
ncbi:MAG: GNAT family N-acetyltransferase, partial [Dehalococcoidia bacterium]|nr:GNAT family N-acetyltransferase [Dehalococcoidia bacterium]